MANLFSKWAAPAGAGAGAALLGRFGGWLVGAAGRLVGYLGARFGRLFGLFGKARRCYRHLEKRLNEEEVPCQVGLLLLMAHIARGQGWHQKLLSKVKDGPVKPIGNDICAVMYAVCKDARRRRKADPWLCLPAYISCKLEEVKLEVLTPDTPHARIVATVGGKQGECGLPPSCRLSCVGWRQKRQT
jgi:hypothetical protein